VGCYIRCSEEGTKRGRSSSPRLLLAVPNVTADPSVASVPITVPLSLLCGFDVPVKGLRLPVFVTTGDVEARYCFQLSLSEASLMFQI